MVSYKDRWQMHKILDMCIDITEAGCPMGCDFSGHTKQMDVYEIADTSKLCYGYYEEDGLRSLDSVITFLSKYPIKTDNN